MFNGSPRSEIPDSEPVSERSYGIIPIRSTSMSTGVTGKLSTSNTEVLLIKQHSFVKGQPPFWSFPKGHAEDSDKSTFDTAIREVREETGITVKEAGILFEDEKALIERYRNPVRGWVKEVTYWVSLVEGDGGGKLDIQIAELADAMWLDWEEAFEMLSHQQGKELLRRVMGMLDRDDQEKTGENEASSLKLEL